MKYELTDDEKSRLKTRSYLEYFNRNVALHREDGPALIFQKGEQEWHINGALHREDGPAFIGANGYQEWYINGKRHREDGPAVIDADGTQYWWINDKYVTNEVVTWANTCDIDLDNLTEPDKLLLKMFMNGLSI